jgi:type IV pilus assembly protein PilB
VSVLSAAAQEQVETNLQKAGLISAAELEQLRQKSASSGQPLLQLLASEKKVSDEELAKAMAEVSKIPYVDLSNKTIDHKILDMLPQELAERYMAVPLGEMENRLQVAMLDGGNVQAVDFLSTKVGRPLKVYAASEAGIRQVLRQYDTGVGGSMASQLSKIGEDLAGGTAAGEQSGSADGAGRSGGSPAAASRNITTIVQDSPISKALSTILEFAAKNRASDVHIEPMENQLKIRCRVDGVLREIMQLPKSSEPPLISRVKILSKLKIDEHRVPQDGEFSVKVLGRTIDLRIAIAPVVWGEQVVIRLLDKSSTSFKLEEMGYTGRSLRTVREGLKQTSGMILTTGPTGSGKTTSMYALLQEVKSEAVNIITLEDPVEYKMDGVNQIQVNPGVGLTFANGLRSVLRQDPDIVMVGEIRDKETAELAVQAALTGHLVFSTLHTNSAAGILPRLLDMGVEPFLIASTVHTVIGQRLLRQVAGNFDTYQSGPVETAAIQQNAGRLLPTDETNREAIAGDLGYQSLPFAGQSDYTLARGKNTPDTPGWYKGRLGVYEAFTVTEQIQQLILQRSASGDIQKVAKSQGMVTMREDGYLKSLAGLTTIEEVNRVATTGDV